MGDPSASGVNLRTSPRPAAEAADVELPGPYRHAAWIGAVITYSLTAALLLGIIAKHETEWRRMIWIEGTAFVWLSCSLLLGCALLAAVNGVVTRLQVGPRRAPWQVTAAWLACAGAFAIANADERFILHEYTGNLGLHGEGWEVVAHPVLLVYLAAAAAFGLMLFRRYRGSGAVRGFFIGGVALFVLSLALDGMGPWIRFDVVEEFAEFAAEASFMVAFYIAFLTEVLQLAHPTAEASHAQPQRQSG